MVVDSLCKFNNLTLDGYLHVKPETPLVEGEVSNTKFSVYQPIDVNDKSKPEFLRIRGYELA